MERIDCHIHPDYSLDAEGSIAAYCARAVELDLTAICFTTHFDLIDDPRVRVDDRLVPAAERAWLDRYLTDIAAVRDEYAGRVRVLAGVEIDYFPGCETSLQPLLAGAPLDYVMGSVHFLDDCILTQPQSAAGYFARTPLETLVRRYYGEVATAAATGMFDAIGHLDIYRRYGAAVYGEALAEAHREHAVTALATLVRHQVGIEVNTSGYRRGGREPYPGADLLRQCRAAGIERVTIGSDCHLPSALGDGIDAGYAALQAAGYTAVCTFEARRPVWHAI